MIQPSATWTVQLVDHSDRVVARGGEHLKTREPLTTSTPATTDGVTLTAASFCVYERVRRRHVFLGDLRHGFY